eukprot:3821010-Prymnesium_polylepis.1
MAESSSSRPSPVGRPRPQKQSSERVQAWDEEWCATELLRLQKKPRLFGLTLQQLGVLEEQLEPRPYETFVDPTADMEAVDLRYEHAEHKRKDLIREVSRRFDKLTQMGETDEGLASGLSARARTEERTSGGQFSQLHRGAVGGTEARRLDVLAKRRTQDIHRMVDFELKQKQRAAEIEETR